MQVFTVDDVLNADWRAVWSDSEELCTPEGVGTGNMLNLVILSAPFGDGTAEIT